MPALAQGQTVICDRYVYSSVAYQGARGVDRASIVAENKLFAIPADVTFLLEISVDIALERITANRSAVFSAFEKREDLEAVAAVYETLQDPAIRRIDSARPPEAVHENIVSILREFPAFAQALV